MIKNTINIILLGDCSDSRFAEEIINKTKGSSKIIYNTGKTISVYDNDTANIQIFISECGKLINYNFDNTIIILKKINLDSNFLADTSKDNIVIFNSENKDHTELLQNNHILAVSCGLSEKDTITFSSKGTENNVISLQREIKFKNSVIEPQEISLPETHCNNYIALATAAITIVLTQFFCDQ